MKNSSVSNINSFVDEEIKKICSEYEEKIRHLENLNKQLAEALAESQQQLLSFSADATETGESAETERSLNKKLTPLETFTKFSDAIKSKDYKEIDKARIDLLDQTSEIARLPNDQFTILLKKMNFELLNTENKQMIGTILKIYLNIKVHKKLNLLKNHFISNNHWATQKLLINPSYFLEKLQLLSNFKLINHQKEFLHKLLTVYAPLLKDKLTNKERAHLFWYAYALDSEDLFISKFNMKQELLNQTNPLTNIYSKNFKKLDAPRFKSELHMLLTSLCIFNSEEIEMITCKLVKKNLIKPPKKGTIKKKVKPTGPPVVHYVYVINDLDKEKIIDTFSLKLETISVKLSNNKNTGKIYSYTIQALVDSKKTKAYITETNLSTYNNKLSPLRLKVSGYPKFKWPSTENSNAPVSTGHTQLQQVSDLKSLGYHHKLDQIKRWDILCTAVKQLGLKKVAYTLAYNTKRLKGRKPDSSTITIWETDLNKLKNQFYKKEFQWPSTKF